MQEDHDLIRIANRAIPYRSCPVDNANDKVRRLWLIKEIKLYCEKQLQNQFNAKVYVDDGISFMDGNE